MATTLRRFKVFIPALLIVPLLVILTACSSSGTTTPAATSGVGGQSLGSTPTTSGGSSAGGSGKTATVDIVAKNMAFDKQTITVPAGAKVTVNFDNQDTSVPHNIAFYKSSAATDPIFVGQMVTGPNKVTESFTAPSEPGTYFFRCDVHPQTMTGQFIVQ